jgi:flagellar motor switch protein FliN/FliY
MVNADIVNEQEKGALTSALGAAAGDAGGTLTGLLTRQAGLSLEDLTGLSPDEAASEFGGNAVNIKVKFSGGVSGAGIFLLHERDAAVMADLMIGQDGSNPPESLSDLHLSAVGEVGSQMASSFGSAIGGATGKKFSLSSSDLEVTSGDAIASLLGSLGAEAVAAKFALTLEGQPDSSLWLFLSTAVAKGLTGTGAAPAKAAGKAPAAGGFAPANTFAASPSGPATVQAAQMPSLGEENYTGGGGNIDLILDVPLQITVELGRTHKTVRDILSFGAGSVVELDKLAGEPVDILVNDRPIAKGEVVVIDENFGIRVTEILSPRERIAL